MNVMLAQAYDPERHDVRGWLASEKLDGVRATWDGAMLRTRNGNEISAPRWFLDQLPADMALDGELWCGRGTFQHCASIVRKKSPVDAEWKDVRYAVFDAPLLAGAFSCRIRAVAERTYTGSARPAHAISQTIVGGHADVRRELARIVDLGGEGLVLRDPASKYEPRRSEKMLKVKVGEELDAVVVGLVRGEGGRLEGLVCERSGGKRFGVAAGLSDLDRDDPPRLGDVVTVGHNGLTDAGLPRFPRLAGIRADVGGGV